MKFSNDLLSSKDNQILTIEVLSNLWDELVLTAKFQEEKDMMFNWMKEQKFCEVHLQFFKEKLETMI